MPKKRQSNFSADRLQKPALGTSALPTVVPQPAAAPLLVTPSAAAAKVAGAGSALITKSKKKSNFDRPSHKSNVAGFVRRRQLVHEQAETGRGRLLLKMPSNAGGEAEADLSFLLDFPGLLEPVADALLCIGEEGVTSSTVINYAQGLNGKGKFFSYLRSLGRFKFSLSDLTTQEVKEFVEWLNQREGVENSTRHVSYYQMRRIFSWLQKSSRWKVQMHPRLQFLPDPWPEVQRKRNDTKVAEIVPQDELGSIYRACLSEATKMMGSVRELRRAMDAAAEAGHPAIEELVASLKRGGRTVKGTSSNPYRDMGVLLATLRRHELHLPIPSNDKLEKISTPLFKAIRHLGGKTEIQRCFYPSFRDLVPFVLLMEIHLYYNKSTLLGSKIGDYRIQPGVLGRDEFVAEAEALEDDEEETGAPTLRADPVKQRAGGKRQLQVRPVTSDADNPATIWAFVQEWTQWIRPLAASLQRDVLFIAVANHHDPDDAIVRPFWSSCKQVPGGQAWTYNLSCFFKDHSLPHHPLSRLRPTMLDMIEVLYGGDIRAKAAAGVHSSEDTTYTKYSTSGQMARGDESLGWVRLWHERWRETKGKVDPRCLPEGKGADVGAATPGWLCADPFSGPFNLERGKACKAYGMCPACPHAGINENSPYAAAMALKLLDAIDKVSEEMSPSAWLERWAPVRKRLVQGWLTLFSDAVLAEATKENSIPLPALE